MSDEPRVSCLLNLSLFIGSYFIIFYGSVLFISIAGYFLHYPMSLTSILVPSAISIIILWIFNQKQFAPISIKLFLLMILIIFLLFLISILISGMFYDLSFDGQWYHQLGVKRLIDGWNPIYQQHIDQISLSDPSGFAKTAVSRFPKGAWICSAALFQATKDLESCKAINFLLIIASIFLSFSALLTIPGNKSLAKPIFLSILVAFNPVTIYQSLSFYVDTQLALIINCIIAIQLLLYQRANWLIYLCLFFCCIILINLKFTGLVYALVLGAGFSALLIFFGKKLVARRVFVTISLGVLLGTFFVGYNPYIVNTLAYANPFYPAINNDIITINRPADFQKLNRLERLVQSVFSASDNAFGSSFSHLKVPFTISLKELKTFILTDTRVGGFGPFFGGILLIALVMFPISVIYKMNGAKEAIALALLILISTIAIAESWWARLAPQLWLIPIFLIIVLLYNDKYLIIRFIGWSQLYILLINICLIGIVYLTANVYHNIKINQMLNKLAQRPNPVQVYFKFPLTEIKFKQMNIKYKEVPIENINCSDPGFIPGIETFYCPK
jgi:hypothetical protein